MDFRIFFEPIKNCFFSIFEWLEKIGGDSFLFNFFTIFIILTVGRLFFRRITGLSFGIKGSDTVRSTKNGGDK